MKDLAKFDEIYKQIVRIENLQKEKIRYISPARKKNFEYTINLDQFLETQDFSQVPTVKPGDVIYIPKKKNYCAQQRIADGLPARGV